MVVIVIALVLTLFVIGLIFARLYRRAAEQAFCPHRSGRPKSGNEWRCNCYAHFSFREYPVNMNTLKLEVTQRLKVS